MATDGTKKYRVTLAPEERAELEGMLAKGTAAATKLTHARVLLKADQAEGGPAWSDGRIVEALDVGRATVARVRERFAEEGLEAALTRRPPDRVYARKIDGRAEAHLVALACSEPPGGGAGDLDDATAGRPTGHARARGRAGVGRDRPADAF